LLDRLAQLHECLHTTHFVMGAGEADGAFETRDEAVPLIAAVQAERGGFELADDRGGRRGLLETGARAPAVEQAFVIARSAVEADIRLVVDPSAAAHGATLAQ
jgi:hypothetical protein